MLVSKSVELGLRGNQILKEYESKGYHIPRKTVNGKLILDYSKKLMVKVEDLPRGSNVKVIVKCDYCGTHFENAYYSYTHSLDTSIILKDTCTKCKAIKIKETFMLKYGVECVAHIPGTGEKITIAKRRPFPDVKKEFESRGYTLISGEDEYFNGLSPLEYKCGIHHNKIQSMPPNYLFTGVGCVYCAREAIGDARRLDFNIIRTLFESKGLILLANFSQRGSFKLPFKCKKHLSMEVQYTSYGSLSQSKYGCKYCVAENTTGENNWNYQGAFPTVELYMRRRTKRWRNMSIKNCGGKCVITGEKYGAVHHLYSFKSIVQEAMANTGLDIRDTISEYTNDEMVRLGFETVRLHFEYPLGVCLRKDIHYLFHGLYTNVGNTPEQFEEFSQRYKSGEFSTLLETAS